MTPPHPQSLTSSVTSDSGKLLLTFNGASMCLYNGATCAGLSRSVHPVPEISTASSHFRPGRTKPEPPAPRRRWPGRINQVKQVGKELLVQSDSSASLHPPLSLCPPPPFPQNHGVWSAVSDPQLGLAGSRRRHGCGENRPSLKSQPLCFFFSSLCARVRVCLCLCLIGPPGDLTILLRCRHEPTGPGGRSAPRALQLSLKGTTVNRQVSSDGGGRLKNATFFG